MDKRIRTINWRVWISSGMDDLGYVVDDPNRPTENQAMRNIRDRAKLLTYTYQMRQYGKKLAQATGRNGHGISSIYDIPKPTLAAHHELYVQSHHPQ